MKIILINTNKIEMKQCSFGTYIKMEDLPYEYLETPDRPFSSSTDDDFVKKNNPFTQMIHSILSNKN